jgi:hypothetical protein
MQREPMPKEGRMPSASSCLISLSDSELSAVMTAAEPLHPMDRSAFLSSVAHRLRLEPEIGPGTMNRVIRELLATKDYRLATARSR